MAGKLPIAVLASGRGTNFKAILDVIKAGKCNAQVKVLICNVATAQAIRIAKDYGVPVEIVSLKQFSKRSDFDDHICNILDKYGIQLVALAGYMLLIKGKKLLETYKNRIINIHPALLPAFPGAQPQKDAFDYGVKVSGFTIHFVDESLDAGPIIYQEAVDIGNCKNEEEVILTILAREHVGYAKVIDSFSKGKYVLDGRRTRFVLD